MRREDEHKLIKAATKGDRSAAAGLIKHHQASVYAYILRLSGRPDVAEDIVQEAFVRVLTNLHRFDYRYRFSTWLFTIARRLFMNAMAKHRPAYDTDAVSHCRGRSDDEPSSVVCGSSQHTAQRDLLDEVLAELSCEQREVLILFHQLDWPISLIAQHLDMPEGTVKSHLHRGRRRMKALLEEREAYAERLAEVTL